MEINNPIQIYYQLAVKIYGGDRVFMMNRSSMFPMKGAVAVHFPEITIVNSEGCEHYIQDLYMKINFKEEGTAIGTLWGTRTTQTTLEASHRYSHSHLDTMSIGSWDAFCLGEGEIATAVANIAYASLPGKDHEVMTRCFEYLLHYLPIFASWESIEGVPYFEISGLLPPSNNNEPLMYNYASFISTCLDNLEYLKPLRVRYSKTYPFVIPIYDIHFESYMKRMTDLRENVTPAGVYIGNGTVDELAGLADSNANILNLGMTKIICKIIHDGEEQEQEQIKNTKRVPRAYRSLFEQILSERLSAEIVRTYPNAATVAKRNSNAFDIRDSIFKNIVPVSNVPK